jgi:hypothetical protein
MRHKVVPLAFFVLAFVLTAGSASATDWVKIVAINPPSPASLPGDLPGSPLAAGNSLEIAFTYNLETQATGRIGFYTAGEAANPAHTGVEIPFMVTHKGQGEGKTRISVECTKGFAGCTIKTIRFDLFFDGPSGLVKLFEDHRAVDYTFTCRTIGTPPGGDKKANVAFAPDKGGNKGLTFWGSNPANKHFVPWNGTVKLSAAEAINPHPTPSNGQCAFNVEYWEMETNGVATPGFRNKLYSDGNERAINGPFALAAGEVKSLVTQPYLDAGGHGFKVVLDADGNVNETNEGDNAQSIRYFLEGRCDARKATTAPVPAAAPK